MIWKRDILTPGRKIYGTWLVKSTRSPPKTWTNTSLVNEVSVMHALLASGVELTLTVVNAVNEDSFQLNYFSDLTFSGSVVIETVGVLFAIRIAI